MLIVIKVRYDRHQQNMIRERALMLPPKDYGTIKKIGYCVH